MNIKPERVLRFIYSSDAAFPRNYFGTSRRSFRRALSNRTFQPMRISSRRVLLLGLSVGAGLVLAQPGASAGVFKNTGNLITARNKHTATLLPNGKVLVAGGTNSGSYLATAELYNPATGTWSVTGSLATTRIHHTATLLASGKVLVVGGQGDTGDLASAELYDPATGTWTPTGSLITARGKLTTTLLADGKVLVVGGFSTATRGFFASAEVYDPASGTWTPTGSLSTARQGPFAVLLPNGKVLVASGSNPSFLTSAELYDPAAGTWTTTGSLANAGNVGALLRNGKVLVAHAFVGGAELYDPASGTWAATGSPAVARLNSPPAILLPDDTVLVAGGTNANIDLASAELYNPASGTWANTASLTNARSFHTATLLPNGMVLIAGGQNSGIDVGSAELFDLGPPIITSPLVATATVGVPFSYQFEASGATSRTARNLPNPLVYDGNLLAIDGTPTTPGTFTIGLSAANGSGTTNANLTLTVQPAPSSGPLIANKTSITGRAGRFFSFKTFTTGGSPTAQVNATGLPPGLSIDSRTGVISGTPGAAGSSKVTLTVTDGAATTSSTLQLTFTEDPGLPVITSPGSAPLTQGQFFSYSIIAPASPDPSDTTTFKLIGSLPAGLSFDAATGKISGTPTAAPQYANGPSDPPEIKRLSGGSLLGSVQLFGTNSHGTSTFQLLFLAPASGAVNISTRLLIGTSENVLIGGFIITGNTPKLVVVRALGPSTGIASAMQDPTLELHDSSGHVVFNDNWKDSQQQIIQDTGIPPLDDRESAIVIALDPGAYTAIISGKNSSTGIGLVEVYDLGTAGLDTSGTAKLAEISTRGTVLSGDNVMIGGFIISGVQIKVIARAIGPSLGAFGIANALQDPTLELHNASGATVRSNDNWKIREDGSSQQAEVEATTVPPTDDRESAIVATLNPGAYTGIVRGKGSATGVALVEVYGLQ
jgi:hypothetical protein